MKIPCGPLRKTQRSLRLNFFLPQRTAKNCAKNREPPALLKI